MASKIKYSEVVRDGALRDYGAVKVDAKHRIVLKGPVHGHYRVYRNDAGQIVLDPQVMIPVREAWLFKNKKPGLQTHKYEALLGPNGEEIFEAYAENKTPAAFRIFWCYGPAKGQITVIAVTAHP